MEVVLKLSVEEVNGILQTLGQLPTSSGAWPLVVKIKQQCAEQLPEKKDAEV
jgi:hypothetical protein